MQAGKGRTNGETAESRLGDRGVNDSLLAESIKQSFRDLVPVWMSLSATGIEKLWYTQTLQIKT